MTPEDTNTNGVARVSWSYQITHPLPSKWPPTAGLELHYYVYAIGHDISGALADGHYLAAPWAKAVTTPAGDTPVKLEILTANLEKIGLQGVRPLTQEERALYNRWPEDMVLKYLAGTKKTTDSVNPKTADFKGFFCTLIGHNKIYAILKPHHETFFRWLGC